MSNGKISNGKMLEQIALAIKKMHKDKIEIVRTQRELIQTQTELAQQLIKMHDAIRAIKKRQAAFDAYMDTMEEFEDDLSYIG